MRSEQELKHNLAAYWRQLNDACGVPDGTLPDDPNPSGVVRRSKHVGQDTPSMEQRLGVRSHSGGASRLPDYETIHQALLLDPHIVAVFEDHKNDVFVPNDLGNPSSYALNEHQWHLLRGLNEHHHMRHKHDFKDAKHYRTRQRVGKLFMGLKQHDPLFSGTNELIRHYMERLPNSGKNAVQEMFGRCPFETLNFYRELRAAAHLVAETYRTRRESRRR